MQHVSTEMSNDMSTTCRQSAPTKLCVGCWEVFVIYPERLRQLARWVPDQSPEELAQEIEWCMSCIVGERVPEEEYSPPLAPCPNEPGHVRCATCGHVLCGRGQVDYHRAYGHLLTGAMPLYGTARPACGGLGERIPLQSVVVNVDN